jgi:hypothetical protein
LLPPTFSPAASAEMPYAPKIESAPGAVVPGEPKVGASAGALLCGEVVPCPCGPEVKTLLKLLPEYVNDGSPSSKVMSIRPCA